MTVCTCKRGFFIISIMSGRTDSRSVCFGMTQIIILPVLVGLLRERVNLSFLKR